MSICVQIKVDETGAVTVGVCPPAEDAEAEEQTDYMEPSESVGIALEKARHLLDTGKPKTMKDAMFPKSKAEKPEIATGKQYGQKT